MIVWNGTMKIIILLGEVFHRALYYITLNFAMVTKYAVQDPIYFASEP